jgi:uncharacterized membrane protein
MTTPIIMLLLLMGPYLSIRLLSCVTHRRYNAQRPAATGLSFLFVFTGVGHFIDAESMAEMLPAWVPERVLLVYLTGALEFSLAAGLLNEKYSRFTGWLASVILVSFFPVNVYAALNHIPMGGRAWGPVYLLIRAPLQAFILLWIYWFVIRRPDYGKRREVANDLRNRDRLSTLTKPGANRYLL